MLIKGDARKIPLVDKSVQCVVTSPPYWSLRDYGIAGQLGLESTPEEYVTKMVEVFRQVWRVLRDDGTVWLNLGSSYAGAGAGGGGNRKGNEHGQHDAMRGSIRGTVLHNFKHKDLIPIPWMVAMSLQEDGWYLRSDIIWQKLNSLPESVRDRPTKAHEYIFLLTKNSKYYYNADAIREPAQNWGTRERKKGSAFVDGTPGRSKQSGGKDCNFAESGRNRRTVWTVTTQALPHAHFATFPEKLITPCILAGSKIGDIVFDPFVGSGTVCRVAEKYNRKGVGLDLTYQDIAQVRTSNIQRQLVGF